MAETKQTAWGNLRAEFIRLVGAYGLNHEVWADMTSAAENAGAGATTTSESRRLFESFRERFVGEGFSPDVAERMARDAAAPRASRLFG